MKEELLNFGLETTETSIIKVIGVGGGGNNAVNHMYRMGISGADFVICNTDSQALINSPIPLKIQLGVTLTEGRGAGSKPEQGKQAAIENIADVRNILEENTRLLFLTACLGGGTGTGAAPVVADLAREMDILTIAIVTIPSKNEGKKRYNQAIEGVAQLRQHVDSILVVDNQNLHTIYGDLPASQAFMKADDILGNAVKGMIEIITLTGNINIDFADVHTVMANSGVFMMGTGYAEGDGRSINAVREAIDSPLVDCNEIQGTKDILLNIISGEDEITIGEIGDIIAYLQDRAGSEANIIWGNGTDLSLEKKIRVTIIASGFQVKPNNILYEQKISENPLAEKKPTIFTVSEPKEEIKNTKQEETAPQFNFVVNETSEEEVSEANLNTTNNDETFTIPSEEKNTNQEPSNNEPKGEGWFQRHIGGLFDDNE